MTSDQVRLDGGDGLGVFGIIRAEAIPQHDEPHQLNDGLGLLRREAGGVGGVAEVDQQALRHLPVGIEDRLVQPCRKIARYALRDNSGRTSG